MFFRKRKKRTIISAHHTPKPLDSNQLKIIHKILDNEKHELTYEERSLLFSFQIDELKAFIAEASKQAFEEIYDGFENGIVTQKQPIEVLVTGACSDLAKQILPRLCSGEVFGMDQPINLRLFEFPEFFEELKAAAIEIEDCAPAWVDNIVATTDLSRAFYGIDFAILCSGVFPNLEKSRRDVAKDNLSIYASFGRALNQFAKRTTKVLVAGHPVNSNCLVLSEHAPSIPRGNITGLALLSMNRAKNFVISKLNVPIRDVRNIVIFGNTSKTIFADISESTVKNEPILDVWTRMKAPPVKREDFMDFLFNRDLKIMQLSKKFPILSMGEAIIKHLRNWALGSKGEMISFVVSIDQSIYSAGRGNYIALPVTCHGGTEYEVVKGIQLDELRQRYLKAAEKEVLDERDLLRVSARRT